MKVEHFLTLTQPWATLMAVGAKKVETRSWPIRFRGWFAIHAAKGFPADCQQLCFAQPFAGVLEAAKYRGPADLPLGKVLAVARLIDCKATEQLQLIVDDTERSFGDYSERRYGFVTEGLRRLKAPFALRGLQRLQRLPSPILEADLI